jgi:hypothetical protein
MENINKPSTSIKNWAVDDRPREKLLTKGASVLSDSELLAILINNGSKEKSAVQLAKDVLQRDRDGKSHNHCSSPGNWQKKARFGCTGKNSY